MSSEVLTAFSAVSPWAYAAVAAAVYSHTIRRHTHAGTMVPTTWATSLALAALWPVALPAKWVHDDLRTSREIAAYDLTTDLLERGFSSPAQATDPVIRLVAHQVAKPVPSDQVCAMVRNALAALALSNDPA